VDPQSNLNFVTARPWRGGLTCFEVVIFEKIQIMPGRMSDVTLLLEAANRGEGVASEELLPLVYDELRRLAAVHLTDENSWQTLQPTALVHEAWHRLVKGEERTWNNRQHFFRVAARAMRRILVDRARHKASLKGGSRAKHLNIDGLDLSAPEPAERILIIDEALTKLEIENPEQARIVTLKFFGGFTNQEIADIQGVTERTIERQWAFAKACLLRLIQSA
jgi:RNA polymerase sigma factor (TIGR02999 family)